MNINLYNVLSVIAHPPLYTHMKYHLYQIMALYLIHLLFHIPAQLDMTPKIDTINFTIIFFDKKLIINPRLTNPDSF